VFPFDVPLAELRRRTSAKWRVFEPDVLPLWVAEMDVRLAPAIRAALDEAVDLGDTGYPAGTDYHEALRRFASDRWGWDGVAVDRTRIVPDVMMGIVEVLRLVTAPGDTVVINTPVYPPFYPFTEHADRVVAEAPLDARLRLDLEVLQTVFRSATADGSRGAAYLLCNPHNPTGTVHSAEELAAVASLAARYGVRVIADEIHGPLVLPGATFTPYLAVDVSGTGFSLTSASKGWNLAGLKAGLVVAGDAAADDLDRLPEEVGHGPSHLGILAHTAAFASGVPWLADLLVALDHNRTLLGDLLAEHLPAVRWVPPQGTFLAWLDCSGLGWDPGPDDGSVRGLATLSQGPAVEFLRRGRVGVSAGPAFGSGGGGHVRLNFATSTAILEEAVRRMADAVR
jgi:cysteine-S-conjugate beta-lyase